MKPAELAKARGELLAFGAEMFASLPRAGLGGACLYRFDTLRPDGTTPTIRSRNGLIVTARRFRAACRDHRLSQESITPSTPEQNGMTRARGECCHRPLDPLMQRASSPQALGHQSPQQYGAQQIQPVA
jgi:hypothetical protein